MRARFTARTVWSRTVGSIGKRSEKELLEKSLKITKLVVRGLNREPVGLVIFGPALGGPAITRPSIQLLLMTCLTAVDVVASVWLLAQYAVEVATLPAYSNCNPLNLDVLSVSHALAHCTCA